jgi:hypothetical protein
MEPIITVEVGKSGVRRLVSRPTTISEANEASLLTARLSFALRMLHQTLNEETAEPIKEITPQIFVPRHTDEELEITDFEQLPLGVAPAPRSLYDNPAPWLIEAVKKANGDHIMWQSIGHELVLNKKGTDEAENPLGVTYPATQEKTLRGGEITELEAALGILVNVYGANGRPSDHWLNESCCGWIEDEQKGITLVSDLYEIDETPVMSVQGFVAEAGLRFTISGTSAHHPSRTMRLKIWKEQ